MDIVYVEESSVTTETGNEPFQCLPPILTIHTTELALKNEWKQGEKWKCSFSHLPATESHAVPDGIGRTQTPDDDPSNFPPPNTEEPSDVDVVAPAHVEQRARRIRGWHTGKPNGDYPNTISTPLFSIHNRHMEHDKRSDSLTTRRREDDNGRRWWQ